MKVLDVQKLVENQSGRYKERMLSQFTRLADSKPSFALYYSIDGVNSSATLGSRDIMAYVTTSNDVSPIKFKKIHGLPIYAVNAITAAISFSDISEAYTEYEDDALIFNSVIKPLPGDHFIIPDFNSEVIFAISDVQVRAIRGEDHYVIHYVVMPNSRILNIESQVVETYETYYRNIGTEDKVLIRQNDYNLVNEYTALYTSILQRYLDDNYDDDYGYLKTPDELSPFLGYGSCKYMIKWLMDNRIVYFDEILNMTFAFETVLPFKSKHNKIYVRSFILNDFIKKNITNKSVYSTMKSMAASLFTITKDEKLAQCVDFVHMLDTDTHEDSVYDILVYDTTFTNMIINKNYTGASPLQLVIAKFINNDDITNAEFADVIDDYNMSDIFRFYFLPLVLMILKVRIKALLMNTK